MRWVAVACALAVVAPRLAEPCASAPPKGATVEIADEEAVIFWDAEHHVEHFIRKAAFRSSAPAFGFLVPTPSVPKLGEVPDAVFGELEHAIEPVVREEASGFEPSCVVLATMSKGDDRPAPESVHVLQTAHVAGFDATTVEADDAAALAGWLDQHGFERTPALTAWLATYTDAHWKITAFVVASDEKQAQRYEVATRAVHMTFPIDRPFYPYREPPSTSTAPRLLRVFVLGAQRFDATLAGAPWTASTVFASAITTPAALRDFAPATTTATVFEDTSAPRQGTDEIYFAPSALAANVRPPDIVVTHKRAVPLELVFLVLLVATVVVAIRRKRR